MLMYMVFETRGEAEAAEAFICRIAKTPITSRNAKTGQPDLSAIKTEKWAIPQQRLDGKWVFPAIPDDLLNMYSVEDVNEFRSRFSFVKEEYQPDWFFTGVV